MGWAGYGPAAIRNGWDGHGLGCPWDRNVLGGHGPDMDWTVPAMVEAWVVLYRQYAGQVQGLKAMDWNVCRP